MPSASTAMAPRTSRKFEGSSKNPTLKFMPMTPAMTTDGKSTLENHGQYPHHVVGVLTRLGHDEVERADELLPCVLDGVECPLQSVVQARPWPADGGGWVLVHRTDEGGEHLPLGCELPPERRDASTDRHEVVRERLYPLGGEGLGVEPVDRLLDDLDLAEVPIQHPIEEQAQERPGIEAPEPRIAGHDRHRPVQVGHRLRMQRYDEFASRHEVSGVPCVRSPGSSPRPTTVSPIACPENRMPVDARSELSRSAPSSPSRSSTSATVSASWSGSTTMSTHSGFVLAARPPPMDSRDISSASTAPCR